MTPIYRHLGRVAVDNTRLHVANQCTFVISLPFPDNHNFGLPCAADNWAEERSKPLRGVLSDFGHVRIDYTEYCINRFTACKETMT